MRRLVALLIAALFLSSSSAWAIGPFIVFFEPNSTRMIRRFSDPMLDNAIQQFRIHDVREVNLAGHTDRAGSFEYNRDLSRRRAEAVRAEFIRRGYSGTFTIDAYGEERPLVDTEDGMAHQENRRVEIVMVCFHNPESAAHWGMRCRS